MTLAQAVLLASASPPSCTGEVHAALAVAASGASCGSTPWLESLDTLVQSPLFEIAVVDRARPPRERGDLGGLGDFRDVRQLVLFEVAR